MFTAVLFLLLPALTSVLLRRSWARWLPSGLLLLVAIVLGVTTKPSVSHGGGGPAVIAIPDWFIAGAVFMLAGATFVVAAIARPRPAPAPVPAPAPAPAPLPRATAHRGASGL